MRNFKSQHGQSLIELLITIALVSILLPALLTSFFSSRQGRPQQNQRAQAVAYIREAEEAVRSVREKGWSTFAVNGTYHPVASSSAWILSAGSEQLNNGTLTRQIVISDVNRDVNGVIATSGGTLDPSTKKAIISVSWTTPIAYTVSSTLFLTRYTNTVYTETTKAQFDLGTKTNVITTHIGDGEVQLASGGSGDWCDPNKTHIVKYDLPGQGVTTAVSATYGHVYTTTGYNASGHSMDSILISDPTQPTPPVISSGGYYDNYKTYGLYADSNYVYLTSNHPKLTVDVINATSPYSQKATYNASGGETGISVVVSGTTGYVTAGSTLYTFDTSNISGSLLEKGKISLAGTGNKVVVIGQYAYVATSSTTEQLQIIDVSNPANMSIVKSIDMKNGLGGVDVFVNTSGSYAYLVTSYASGKADFFIIDISDKEEPKIHGSYSTNGMNPNAVIAVSGNHAIIVGSSGNPYQVLDVSNIDTPTYCMPQGFSLSGVTNINAIATISEIDGDVYSYILTDDSNNEFQIIEGGPGGQAASSGIFESQTFNASADASFNRFYATVASPSATAITFQVAAEHAISGSCSGVTFNYIGPDGTGNTKFATGSAIPLNADNIGFENPGQCMRYKAFLSTTDPSQSPILYDINFNYSP